MANLYNTDGRIDINQKIYDSFNDFIFSNDRNVFNKLMSRKHFYDLTKNLHGDIVECGVFKGSGLLSWLKIVDMYEPNSLKKVIGFDFFGSDFVNALEDDIDRETMMQVFTRDNNLQDSEISIEGIKAKIENAGFSSNKYELVQGDVSITTEQYLKERPGLRISILYLDMDLDKPTYDALNNLWDRIVPGGVVVFDEYAYHSWSESNAVDRFVNEFGLELENTFIKAPTAYILKP
jgi:hypothetical protein